MGTIYPNMVVGNKDDMAKQGQKMVGSGGRARHFGRTTKHLLDIG